MDFTLAVNARFRFRRTSGMERYAHEISARLKMPKRFIAPSRPLGQAAGHLWEQFVLPVLLHKTEMLWSPANAGAWMVQRQAVTIHDASVFDHPEWFRSHFAAWTRLSWRILAKRAKAILTVSEFSKHRLKRHLGISDGKICVVHNGVAKPFEPQPQKRIQAVKEKYGIKKAYFLFVGTLEPRKNFSTLLQAWQTANLRAHELFIAGAEGKVFAPVTVRVSNTTFIPDEDLPALYSGAAAFVFPSLYEGFGLPVLEAMACGTPVVTSNMTALAELFGDSALLVAPDKPEEIAQAMQTILEDNSLAGSLRERGLKKAGELTWETSAMKTEEILKSTGAY